MEGLMTDVSPFSSVPDDCIATIISFTSPKDACNAAAVSPGFRSIADSDAVWERFLPLDYEQLISKSDSLAPFSTKKQLYHMLSDSGLFLHGGKWNFKLSKPSGKKCYMFCARELQISWMDTPIYWNWKSLPESRFAEVAELRFVCWLDISVRIPTELLSPNTDYAPYLVFKLEDDHYGLDYPSNVSVKCIGRMGGEHVPVKKITYIVPPHHRSRAVTGNEVVRSTSREDGWMEIELGEFFVPEGDGYVVEARLFQTKLPHWKKGLIVEGIEVRPKEAPKRLVRNPVRRQHRSVVGRRVFGMAGRRRGGKAKAGNVSQQMETD